MPPKKAASPKSTPAADGAPSPAAPATSPTKKKKMVKKAPSTKGTASPEPPAAGSGPASAAESVADESFAPSSSASPAGSRPTSPSMSPTKKSAKRPVTSAAKKAPAPAGKSSSAVSAPLSAAAKAVAAAIDSHSTAVASLDSLQLVEGPAVVPAPFHEVIDVPDSLSSQANPLATENKMRRESLRRTIEEFYSVVAPDRAGKADDVATKYFGNELRLFGQLETKYRFGVSERKDRRRRGDDSPSSGPVPVYPAGYLQKEYHKNLTSFAIAGVCKEQMVANKIKEQRLMLAKAKTATAASSPTAPQPPKPKSKDAIAKEVDAMLAQMPTDVQVSELVRLSSTSPMASGSMGVWGDVAVRTYSQTLAEKAWDRKVIEYFKNKNAQHSDSAGGIAKDFVAFPKESDMSDDLDLEAPISVDTSDATLWQLIHEHHQRVRRSLFNGEIVVDEVLPTGEAKVKATSGAPTSTPATVLHACIGAGYASTCDVTPRQQVQALVLKYCPQNMLLVLPALWLYRGREHELITKLHAEHGLDKPAPAISDTLATSSSMALAPSTSMSIKPKAGAGAAAAQDYLASSPNTLNSYPDPLVGSEIYLSEAMNGSVCGISREAEFDTRFGLVAEGLTGAKGGTADGAPPPAPPCTYPCEDVTFRSWSNIPPQLQATAHMARHFGLGPQFVHQLHAQNPLNPDACGFELLCALFPDAVYFCLDDDEQRLAFMTKRVSELLSFVQVCDPTFTRPHRGLPEGSDGSGLQSSLQEAIPKLFQKYSPLKDTLTDEQYAAKQERDRNEVDTSKKYTRKPSKQFKHIAGLDGGAFDDFGSGGDGYKNRPERALADAFAQHFGQQLLSSDQASFQWEDMYNYINEERHQQVLGNCSKWAGAYGPLPPIGAIQLDLVGAAMEVTIKRSTETVSVGTDSDSLHKSTSVTTISLTSTPAPESSRTTKHTPSTEADPFAPTLTSLAPDRSNLTPSFLHRLACQHLTRSTPTVHESILKPWLRNTSEVGTMTRHKEEEILNKMLYTRSVGTCVAEDEVNLGDDKYGGWPIPFRYEEEYRQAVSKMSLPELRRERHRALFGGRRDPGVLMFGDRGRPLPPTASRLPKGSSTGVRIAADGTIDLSSSPSRSPPRTAARAPGASPSAVADFYRFEKDYEQWFEENVGESGRGRFNYKSQVDPDREARRKHRELYFGAKATLSDSDKEDPNYNPKAYGKDDAALMDEVFGDNYQHANKGHASRILMGPYTKALVVADKHKSPFWFDHFAEDYAEDTDEYLASRTSADGVVALVSRFRKGQAELEAARKEANLLTEEVRKLRAERASSYSPQRGLLSVPTLEMEYSEPYPRTFATALRPSQPHDGGLHCRQCDELQSKVSALTAKLSSLRNVNNSNRQHYQQQIKDQVDDLVLRSSTYTATLDRSPGKESIDRAASALSASHISPTKGLQATPLRHSSPLRYTEEDLLEML